MRKFIILSLVLSMTSLSSNAQTCSAEERQACQEALNAADQVIANEEALILKLTESNDSLRTENDKLSNALVEMKDLNDKAIGTTAVWTFAGIGVGLLTAIIISGKH